MAGVLVGLDAIVSKTRLMTDEIWPLGRGGARKCLTLFHCTSMYIVPGMRPTQSRNVLYGVPKYTVRRTTKKTFMASSMS
jgi:hypothetical protein